MLVQLFTVTSSGFGASIKAVVSMATSAQMKVPVGTLLPCPIHTKIIRDLAEGAMRLNVTE